MDFLTLAKARYSVRKFKPDAVPAELIEKIVEAGCVAPTACNRQPVEIIAVTGRDGLERMKQCTRYCFDAPLIFIICYDKDRCWVRSRDGQDSGFVDASIVTTHMTLEAADLGLGSTWVMSFDPAELRRAFDLAENLVPAALLPTGYPADDAAPADLHTKFRPTEEMVKYR